MIGMARAADLLDASHSLSAGISVLVIMIPEGLCEQLIIRLEPDDRVRQLFFESKKARLRLL
jgi:hypothetical protein